MVDTPMGAKEGQYFEVHLDEEYKHAQDQFLAMVSRMLSVSPIFE